jgi:ADP-heptose:LPS heptosyltransferase
MRIAILRALRLGDMLCAVPALRAVRAAWPKAEITLLGLPWARAFVDRFSALLDRFVEFPGWPGLLERPPRLDAIPEFLAQAQARRYDLALQMHGSGNLTNPLLVALGARQNGGLYRPGELCPDPTRFFPFVDGIHEVEQWLRLVDGLGMARLGSELWFPIGTSDRAALADLPLRPPYACVHPGASDLSRCWPPERFARVADRLAERGLQVILTGMPAEREVTRAVAGSMRHPALDLAPYALGLGPLAALLEGARILVGNDTGVAHLAAAVRLPGVIVFTTADPARWAPQDTGRYRIVSEGREAPVERVVDSVECLLDDRGPERLQSAG